MNAEFKINGKVIETERLVLRPFCLSDLDDFFEYASVDGVGEMAGWKHHESKDKSREILDMFISEDKTFAICLKKNGKVIGSLGIEKSPDEPEIPEELLGREIGYVLSKEYWGRGLMPEAVKAVIDYCFRELHYDFLACAHFVRNSQSRRVIEKCDFQFLKEVKHETRYGTVEDTLLYIQYRNE